MKFAFLSFHKQLIFQKLLEDLSDVLDMSLFIRGKYQNVIHIYKNKSVQIISKHIIYKSLEDTRCIS